MKVIKKRIAVGGISTECSTYSTLSQNDKDFESIQNKELINLIDFSKNLYNIQIKPITKSTMPATLPRPASKFIIMNVG